jgi:hypothetical protein
MTKTKKELIKKIKEVFENYDYLVVDDNYTENPNIWGSNASKSSLDMGGGKVAVYCSCCYQDPDDPKSDPHAQYVLKDTHSVDGLGVGAGYTKIEEFATAIIKYWERGI